MGQNIPSCSGISKLNDCWNVTYGYCVTTARVRDTFAMVRKRVNSNVCPTEWANW